MSGTTSNYTLTPNYGFFKPVYNADVGNWGGHLNQNADKIDSLLASVGAGGSGVTEAPSDGFYYGRYNATWTHVAPLTNAGLLGTPTAPTAAPGTNTTQLATTAFVEAAIAGGVAGVSSWNTRTGAVTLTSGDVTAALAFTPYNATNPSGYQTATQVANVLPIAATTTPAMDGTAAIGIGVSYARADHVHPSDTTHAPIANPTFSAGVFETSVAVAASAINLQAGTSFTKTAAGALTWTVTNVPASGVFASFILELTNGGAFTQTWMANTRWAGGTAPTLTASGRDILGFFTHDAGANWNGLLLGKGMA